MNGGSGHLKLRAIFGKYVGLSTLQDFIQENESLLIASGIGNRNGTMFSVTRLGQDLYNYGISKVQN